jgi:hypothetical protein
LGARLSTSSSYLQVGGKSQREVKAVKTAGPTDPR